MKIRNESTADGDRDLPRRTEKETRQADQAMAAATENEPGPARPGRETGGTWRSTRDV